MAKKVALMTRHHSTLICREARELLLNAGFEIVSNDTGRILSREEQKALIQDAYAIVAGTEQYDRDMLAGCENLKVVTRFGVGTDNFDLAAMREMGLEVGVIANYNAVAEFALTLILSVLKNLPRYDAAARQGLWSRFPMRELTGKTVGIVGFGRIGKRLAELLSGFGVTILAYDPYMNEAAAAERKVQPVSLDALLQRSDIVSLHLPATEQTYHLINENTLGMMKEGAYLINTSRGALVDEKALYDALTCGRLSGAAMDVYEKEPISAENPLFSLPNAVFSPHCSALTFETNYNGGIICAQSIVNVAQGQKPLYPLW